MSSGYFYRPQQFEKYRDILKTLNEADDNNKKLTLHQFMMGKGKTSVFTPLLSASINLFNNKTANIITMSNLVNQTKQGVNFIGYLTGSNINVYSDFKAKERFINNTDISLKYLNEDEDEVDFTKEINLIDEFDNHYNYLQSVYNIIIDRQLINEEFIFILF